MTGTRGQIQTRPGTAPALFLYKKARCPSLLWDGFVVCTFRAHRFTRILCFLRTGAPGPLQGGRASSAVTKHGAACPSAFSGENACQWVAISNPPPGLHQASTRFGEKEGIRKTSIHKSMPCSPSDQPRCSPVTAYGAVARTPEREARESPGCCYKVTMEISQSP